MTTLWSRFRHSAAGNTTILFALVSVPLLMSAGIAIDYLRYTDVRTDVQSALDAAALAAALPEDKTDAQRAQIAEDYFAKNLGEQVTGNQNFRVKVNANSVEVHFKTKVRTSFMALGGFKTLLVDEMTEVMRPFDGSAEVVLVLDYSKSMDEKNKYQDMRDAATTMIDNLDAAVADDKLKMGLVPFSAMVYTEMDKNYVTQFSATPTWVGCTQDRHYPHNTTVDTPTADAATKWGYIEGGKENNGAHGCAAYDDKHLKIVPLTANLSQLKNKLDDMQPLGNTNIPLGAEFGWNLLDPQLPYDQAVPYSDKKTRKFLVLLTDGVQTSKEFGEDDIRSKENGNANLLQLCSNMRDAGIVVFTIAYDITDPAVTNLLKSCAPGRYFEPDAESTEINQVFSQVTQKIKNQVARLAK